MNGDLGATCAHIGQTWPGESVSMAWAEYDEMAGAQIFLKFITRRT